MVASSAIILIIALHVNNGRIAINNSGPEKLVFGSNVVQPLNEFQTIVCGVRATDEN